MLVGVFRKEFLDFGLRVFQRVLVRGLVDFVLQTLVLGMPRHERGANAESGDGSNMDRRHIAQIVKGLHLRVPISRTFNCGVAWFPRLPCLSPTIVARVLRVRLARVLRACQAHDSLRVGLSRKRRWRQIGFDTVATTTSF